MNMANGVKSTGSFRNKSPLVQKRVQTTPRNQNKNVQKPGFSNLIFTEYVKTEYAYI